MEKISKLYNNIVGVADNGVLAWKKYPIFSDDCVQNIEKISPAQIQFYNNG